MELEKLYSMQRDLDTKIEKQHNLQNADLVEEKILALLVELGELANETRCFKFWSIKPASPRNIILEEYVDGLHFLLSIGLTLGFSASVSKYQEAGLESLTEQFLLIYDLIARFKEDKQEEGFLLLFASFMTLGEMLGFSWDDVERAYFMKNQVNHERQQEGY